MLHHNRDFSETLEADRLNAAAMRRPPVDAGEVRRVVRGAAAGDSVAWSTLLERFAGRVRGVARSHRLTVHDAEDVVQTTWLRLLEHVGTVRDPSALGAWLETTARRESLRVIRATQRERPTDGVESVDEPARSADDDRPVDDPAALADDDRWMDAQRSAAVGAALECLPSRHRKLLSMLFGEPAASYAEISHSLGMPIGSIGPTRARLLARLRRDQDFMSALGEDAGSP